MVGKASKLKGVAMRLVMAAVMLYLSSTQTERLTDDRETGRQRDRQTKRHAHRGRETGRQRDRQTERHTQRSRERLTDRQTERHTQRSRERLTDRQTDRQRQKRTLSLTQPPMCCEQVQT